MILLFTKTNLFFKKKKISFLFKKKLELDNILVIENSKIFKKLKILVFDIFFKNLFI